MKTETEIKECLNHVKYTISQSPSTERQDRVDRLFLLLLDNMKATVEWILADDGRDHGVFIDDVLQGDIFKNPS